MKLMRSNKARTILFFFLLALLFNPESLTFAQTKKQTAKSSKSEKKSVAKKIEKPAKDAKKERKTDTAKKQEKKKADKDSNRTAAKSKKVKEAASGKKSTTAKAKEKSRNAGSVKEAKVDARSKNDKLTAKEKESRKKADAERLAAAKKAEAERRRIAEERRQAALAEQKRREQAAREARERRIAFERGLKTETAENIEKDDSSGEDLRIRKAAVDALGSRAGTVVVMEAKTGKILTMVNQDWAVKKGFKPCSTIKLVTGVAGIDEGVINDDGGIGESTGGMKLDGALAKSNNGYFQRVGSNIGSSKMIGYAKKLGLGERTGINSDGEAVGKLPYGNGNARIYSHGDDFEVTPLQLAVMVSALSNGGRKVVPRIAVVRSEKASFQSKRMERIELPKKSIEGVLPGMLGAAEYGTARRGVDSSLGIAGKTGSCIGGGSWVGLFASVAPVEDPLYSVVVITRGQGERGRFAAAVAGRVYEALRPRISRNFESQWAKENLKSRAQIDNATAFAEEGEDEDADETPIIVGSRPNQPPAKKLVQKIVQSKPTNFPPVIITYDKSGAERQRPRVVKN